LKLIGLKLQDSKMTKKNKLRKVLAIDDSPTDLALLKAHLQKMGLSALATHDVAIGIDDARD